MAVDLVNVQAFLDSLMLDTLELELRSQSLGDDVNAMGTLLERLETIMEVGTASILEQTEDVTEAIFLTCGVINAMIGHLQDWIKSGMRQGAIPCADAVMGLTEIALCITAKPSALRLVSQ